ncbi:MAG: glutathione S-transferase [Pseudomonadota bacterium]|nr:glutathione S-transferase [Pseudomonadota bacterium]
MKLRYSPTSPYVRKVTVTAFETGLEGRIQRVPTDPWDPRTDLGNENPLGRVPTLTTDDGFVLFDSPVICEYLDSLHHGPKLFPESAPERWQVLRQQALADGILDATAAIVTERLRRPEPHRWPQWIEFQKQAIHRGLAFLEREIASFGLQVTIGQIAAGCALGFLDFRLPDEDWRQGHSALSAWYRDFAARPSMAATVPALPK